MEKEYFVYGLHVASALSTRVSVVFFFVSLSSISLSRPERKSKEERPLVSLWALCEEQGQVPTPLSKRRTACPPRIETRNDEVKDAAATTT